MFVVLFVTSTESMVITVVDVIVHVLGQLALFGGSTATNSRLLHQIIFVVVNGHASIRTRFLVPLLFLEWLFDVRVTCVDVELPHWGGTGEWFHPIPQKKIQSIADPTVAHFPDHGTPVEPRIEEVEKPWHPSVSFDSISRTGELALDSLLQLRESVCELQAMT